MRYNFKNLNVYLALGNPSKTGAFPVAWTVVDRAQSSGAYQLRQQIMTMQNTWTLVITTKRRKQASTRSFMLIGFQQ